MEVISAKVSFGSKAASRYISVTLSNAY